MWGKRTIFGKPSRPRVLERGKSTKSKPSTPKNMDTIIVWGIEDKLPDQHPLLKT